MVQEEDGDLECLRLEKAFLKLIRFIDEHRADGTEVEPLPKWFFYGHHMCVCVWQQNA